MKSLSIVFLSCLIFAHCAAESKQEEIETPPPFIETRYATSRSAALKVLKGESDGTISDVALLDDNTVVELVGPFGKHDAYIFFVHVPCKEAVPLLISSLGGFRYWKGKEEEKVFECTWAHLRGALAAQTGEDFGFDQSAWQAWWESKGKQMPDTFFEKNVEKLKKANRLPEPTSSSSPVAHR